MKIAKGLIAFAISVALVGVVAVVSYKLTVGSGKSFGEATRVCYTTQTKVNIGHQVSTKILNAGSRQWAIVQQPRNATNTVALSFDQASSTLADGYILYPTISASTTDNVRFGFATDLPTSNFVEAITDLGSTTITVIECK